MRNTTEAEFYVAARQCLARAGFRLERAQTDALVVRLSETLSAFRANRRQPASTYRQVHDHLRRLWHYAHRDDCNAARLLVWLNRLPAEALARMERRAATVLPKLFPGAPTREDFLAWAARANAQILIRAVGTLSADGAMPVRGRRQASGKRSRSRLEPVIANHVRGDNRPKPRGGRPAHAVQDALVRDLAIDWLLAVGALPVFGRSDRTGFGDLVHTMFDLVDEPGATQALRRYATELRRAEVSSWGER